MQQANAANIDRAERRASSSGRRSPPRSCSGSARAGRSRSTRSTFVISARCSRACARARAGSGVPPSALLAELRRRLAGGPLAPVGVGGDRGDVARAAARARAVPDARADVAEDRYDSTGVFGALAVALGDRDAARLARRAALAAAPPDPLRDGVGRDVAAGVRAVRARAARWRCVLPLFVLVGFGFSMFDVSWDTTLAGADPAARAVARERVRLDGLAGAAAARLPAGRARWREAFGAVEVLVVGVVCWRRWRSSSALVTPGVWRLQNSPRPSSGVEASA